MDDNYVYYIAEGRSRMALEAHFVRLKVYRAGIHEIVASLGLPADTLWYESNGKWAGFSIPVGTVLPDALRREKNPPDCCVAKLKSDAGKAFQAQLSKLEAPEHHRLFVALCGSPFPFEGHEGHRLITSGYATEHLDGKIVIRGRVGILPPFDAVPLKRSAYWLLREASDDGDQPADAHNAAEAADPSN